MAKNKKNSNYITEKTAKAQAEREAAKLKEQKDKKIKTIALAVGIPLLVMGLAVGILFGVGAFDYSPEPTYDATFSFDDGSSLHIELYGKDAPETVKHFRDLCEDGHFDGRTAHSLLEGLLYIGADVKDATGIKGEFADNGVENKIPMKKGVVCMARGEDKNSAYGQFFVLTKNDSSLKGQYAAFGRVTDLDALESLVKSLEVDEKGNVTNSPKITGVSLHAAHH